ncbi:MAG: chemotaxis protein CheA [Pyrinomonadaceae bacterium]|nr:chemotaxis protein CheA [Phycisphaerales bacterium]
MAATNFDAGIMQDFLTESGELVEQLDRDLVLLEETPADLELLNRIFRALHTIKGSASFLALTNLVHLAHAAESALNSARNRVFVVDRPVMDLLLQVVDILRRQMTELTAGDELCLADPRLIASLTSLGEGKGLGKQSDAPSPPEQEVTHEPADAAGDAPIGDINLKRTKLRLPSSKSDLLGYLVSDAEQTLLQITDQLEAVGLPEQRRSAAGSLAELLESLNRAAKFFEFEAMERCTTSLVKLTTGVMDLAEPLVPAAVRLGHHVLVQLNEQLSGLENGELVERSFTAIEESVNHLIDDGVIDELAETEPSVAAAPGEGSEPSAAGEMASAANEERAEQKKDDGAAPGAAVKGQHAAVEQTIRVEVGRLEALLNLVGELVLQKNRIGAISRKMIGDESVDSDVADVLSQSTEGLDRLTSDIQVAVMRTRMQPLDKLFGKYPRLIRDLARKTGKQMRLVIEGADTEVDKSVIEELADPLIHLIRNSADHGLEPPADRVSAKKPECGTIHLSASHEGSHVLIRIRDDGRGLRRDKIGAKAVARGIVTEAELATMSDQQVRNFIFAAGFSTAEVVSDLSGRGVGMDVVRTNIEKIKGSIELDSEPGVHTTVSIKIPLTVAIMTAMMVGIGDEIYAVPLHSIYEIVRPCKEELASIRSSPVMRLRETVLPLVDGCLEFGVPAAHRRETPFAVVLGQGDKRVGLLVSRLIGQQQIVIKPLDSMVDGAGPVSGATVRDDGGVSLIVDVAQMIQLAQKRRHSALTNTRQ